MSPPPNPGIEFGLGLAQDFEGGAAVVGWRGGVGRTGVMAIKDFGETSPQVILHFRRQTIELLAVNQETARVTKEALVQIKLAQGSGPRGVRATALEV